MTYQKPELSVLGNAQMAILGSDKIGGPTDNDVLPFTTAAYDVDE